MARKLNEQVALTLEEIEVLNKQIDKDLDGIDGIVIDNANSRHGNQRILKRPAA